MRRGGGGSASERASARIRRGAFGASRCGSAGGEVIDRKTVMHVAELAALSLDGSEVDALAKDLDAIVKYVDELSAIDTEGVEPMRSISTAGALRPDVPQPSLSREDALGGADAFVVPAFVEA